MIEAPLYDAVFSDFVHREESPNRIIAYMIVFEHGVMLLFKAGELAEEPTPEPVDIVGDGE